LKKIGANSAAVQVSMEAIPVGSLQQEVSFPSSLIASSLQLGIGRHLLPRCQNW